MSTFAELKQLIADDLDRDDLTSVIDDYVRDRIRHFQREFFYGSPQTVTFTTVPGQVLYPMPETIVNALQLRMLYYANWQLLSKVQYVDILALDTNVPSTQSPPDLWAPFGLQVRIYPSPDGRYPIEISGAGKLPLPANENATNWWTTEAANLIRLATTAQIRQLVLRDYDGAKQDDEAAEEERFSLLCETMDREAQKIFAINWVVAGVSFLAAAHAMSFFL